MDRLEELKQLRRIEQVFNKDAVENGLVQWAVDEIERLRLENQRLRERLGETG